jgi:hypothetical protein
MDNAWLLILSNDDPVGHFLATEQSMLRKMLGRVVDRGDQFVFINHFVMANLSDRSTRRHLNVMSGELCDLSNEPNCGT